MKILFRHLTAKGEESFFLKLSIESIYCSVRRGTRNAQNCRNVICGVKFSLYYFIHSYIIPFTFSICYLMFFVVDINITNNIIVEFYKTYSVWLKKWEIQWILRNLRRVRIHYLRIFYTTKILPDVKRRTLKVQIRKSVCQVSIHKKHLKSIILQGLKNIVRRIIIPAARCITCQNGTWYIT